MDPGSGGLLSLSEAIFISLGEALGASSFGLGGFHSLLSVGFVGFSGGLSDQGGVGVESIHQSVVLEGVLLLQLVSHDVGFGGVHDRLDFIGVDQSGQIGVGHGLSGELIPRFLRAVGFIGSEQSIQGAERGLREHAESSDLASGGELSEAESVDIGHLNAGHVSEGLDEFHVFIGVDDQRSLLDSVSVVSELSLSGSEGLRGDHLLHVLVHGESLEEGHGLLGFLVGFELVFHHQRELDHVVDLVATGHDQGGHRGGREGAGDRVALLVDVHLAVPSAEDLEGGEHVALSTHVSEGGLAGAVGTGAGNSGNTGHGSTSAPGFGGVLLTGGSGNGVGLAGVFG